MNQKTISRIIGAALAGFIIAFLITLAVALLMMPIPAIPLVVTLLLCCIGGIFGAVGGALPILGTISCDETIHNEHCSVGDLVYQFMVGIAQGILGSIGLMVISGIMAGPPGISIAAGLIALGAGLLSLAVSFLLPLVIDKGTWLLGKCLGTNKTVERQSGYEHVDVKTSTVEISSESDQDDTPILKVAYNDMNDNVDGYSMQPPQARVSR